MTPAPLSQRFPEKNCLPFENVDIVIKQLLPHNSHRLSEFSTVKSFNSSSAIISDTPFSSLSFASIAAPKAPIKPEISGLITSLPRMVSIPLSTASL